MNENLDLHIEMMQAIVKDLQQVCDSYIKQVRSLKRWRNITIICYIILFDCVFAGLSFYRQRYVEAGFNVLYCMGACSFCWWSLNKGIELRRTRKREAARLKLEAEKVLGRLLERKEKGFE